MTIPIVFASSNEYAPYASVAIVSIMENKHADTKYDFYLLVPGDFSDTNKHMIQAECSRYTNYTLNFIDMENKFADTKSSRWGKLCYYKLLIAEVLPVQRCICLGGDVIVNVDLTELFNTDIGDNYFAMVQVSVDPKGKTHHNVDSMVMNLDQIRAHKLTQKFLDNVEKYHNEEHIINVICAGHIYRLPYKYNVLMFAQFTRRENYIALLMDKAERHEGEVNPAVMHYIGPWKPWSAPSVLLHVDRWYHYAKKSVFFEMILQNLIINMDTRIVQCQRNLKNDVAMLKNEISKLANKRTIILSYYRCKLLSVFTFGKKRERYIAKRDYFHGLMEQIKLMKPKDWEKYV